MKNRFFYLTIIVFLITLVITAFLYYMMGLTSVVEFDNELVNSRNDVITQIDVLSNTLNQAETSEEIDVQINQLIAKRDELKEDYKNANKPNRNGDDIIEANENFLEKTSEIITTAEQYRNSFTQDDIDPVAKMNEYNTKVSELSQIIEDIKETLEDNENKFF